MHEVIPKVAAIHDISGIGRCSLSVILPVLSAMGSQVCAIPTAVLSSHTGGFGDVVFEDLSDFIKNSLEHYRRLNYEFQCVYTGFLASEKQIDSCLDFFKEYKNSLKVVDPVMGDHGKAYKTYTKGMINRMIEMVQEADLITPNLTEANMLLNSNLDTSLTRSQAKSMLAKLSEKGPSYIIITGVPMVTDEIYNICFDSKTGAYWYVKCRYVPVSYPGTGDIFAAITTGAILQGDSLPIAVEKATRFLELTIHTTYTYSKDKRDGVMFEKTLPWLTQNQLFSGYQAL